MPRESLETLGAAVADRAKRSAKQLVGRTILWVDDHPEWLIGERRLVRRMGMFVEAALSNQEASRTLADPANAIDIVVSDIKRDEGPSGLQILEFVAAMPR